MNVPGKSYLRHREEVDWEFFWYRKIEDYFHARTNSMIELTICLRSVPFHLTCLQTIALRKFDESKWHSGLEILFLKSEMFAAQAEGEKCKHASQNKNL